MKGVTLPTETVFVMEMSPIKFGLGAMDEIGFDARRLAVTKALIFTDRNLGELGVQVIGSRYREDLCLDAAEVIEARHGLPTPIDPLRQ